MGGGENISHSHALDTLGGSIFLKMRLESHSVRESVTLRQPRTQTWSPGLLLT